MGEVRSDAPPSWHSGLDDGRGFLISIADNGDVDIEIGLRTLQVTGPDACKIGMALIEASRVAAEQRVAREDRDRKQADRKAKRGEL